jgi:hypothetical protein
VHNFKAEMIMETLIMMSLRHYDAFKTQAVLIAVDVTGEKNQLES